MELLSIILVSISLSMDAFSLSLAYGTLDFSRMMCKKLSLTVGIFHFFMPLLGMLVKYFLVLHLSITFHFVTFFIYIYLGIMLLLELKEERQISLLTSFSEILLFSLAVSIDSFTVGIALENFTLLAPLSFAIFSCFFTFLGLKLGKKMYHLFGKFAIILGSLFFFLLAILHL